MTFLIILAGYIVGMLITARVIGNEIYKDDDVRATYGQTVFAILWPAIVVICGWEWWVSGAERKEMRAARKESKKRAAEIAEREKKNAERDDVMRPWKLMLRDPDASEEMKAFAKDVLRGLAEK